MDQYHRSQSERQQAPLHDSTSFRFLNELGPSVSGFLEPFLAYVKHRIGTKLQPCDEGADDAESQEFLQSASERRRRIGGDTTRHDGGRRAARSDRVGPT